MNSANRERADRLLAEFGALIGLDGLALDEAGNAQLAFDEVFVNLDLDEARNALVATAPLGDTQAPDVYARLLDANLFWSGTAGGTIAREPVTGSIVLLHDFPLSEHDSTSFSSALEGFVDAAETLAADIAAGGTSDRSDADLPQNSYRFIQA
jgi:hypothetical protein